MKKLLSTLLILFAGILQLPAQLLYRIEGGSLAKPSYVIGTYHLASTSFASKIPGLDEALLAVDQVYGELDMAPILTDPAVAKRMQQAMLLPEGQTLDKLLTPDQYKRLNTFLKSTLGADLSSPILASMKSLTPAAIEMQLQLYLCMQIEQGFNPQDLFDNYFQKKAKEQGKPVGGLETVDFQINILYRSKPIDRQVTLLMCLIDNPDYQKDVMSRIAKAFYAQDLATLGKVMNEKRGNSCDATAEEEARLITQRNRNWAAALPAIMAKESTLFAVGAGHLPGEQGLLSLLRAQGYSVTPVE